MIFRLTSQDRARLERLQAVYERRFNENEELIEKLRPGDNGPGGPDGAIPGSYEEELMNSSYQEWLAGGSPEWRAARVERARIIDEYSKAIDYFYAQAERQEFAKLGGDREKILDSAREQISIYIESKFNRYMGIISEGRDDDGDEISAFSARDMRVDGSNIYLDTAEVIRDCKEDLLKLHYEALACDLKAVEELDSLVLAIIADDPRISSDKGDLGQMLEVKIRKPKKPRKPRSKKKIPTFNVGQAQDFFMFPTTPSIDLIYSLCSHGADVHEAIYKAGVEAKNVGKLSTGKVVIGDNYIQIIRDGSETIIEVLESKCKEINGREAKKILYFTLSEAYKRFYSSDSGLHSCTIDYSLQDLVDKGLYTSTDNARRAFNSANNFMTAIRISAMSKRRGRVLASSGGGRFEMFPAMFINNNQCIVDFNPRIDWNVVLDDYCLMPDVWWTLPGNAADLMYKIFRIMRMNQKSIDSSGNLKANVSLRSVAYWLNLPVDSKKNPKRDVKDRIEEAVKHILESLDKEHFNITIKTNLNASLDKYLDGYLEVVADGAYTKNLLAINVSQKKFIEKNVKKKERIVEEASARSLAEKMKREESE